MRRRDVFTLLSGAAAWPLVASAQQRDPVKRIAWVGDSADDAAIFGREIARLGWVEGRDVRIDYRVEPDERRVRAIAPEIVGAAPDLIVTAGTLYTQIFKRLTDGIPIVFKDVADPVASGLVASFAHPGGNVTGFSNYQFSFAGKWLSILKELVPGIANVMMLYELANSNWQGFLPVLEAAASPIVVTVRPAPANVTVDVVRQIETFARNPGGGMIVIPAALTVGNYEMIVALAARHRLPAIYAFKLFAASGGLVSYGADRDDLTRRAAQYADRIFKGAKPADLPIEAPIKFELVLNTKAAKALGLEVPTSLLALADEVIE